MQMQVGIGHLQILETCLGSAKQAGRLAGWQAKGGHLGRFLIGFRCALVSPEREQTARSLGRAETSIRNGVPMTVCMYVRYEGVLESY